MAKLFRISTVPISLNVLLRGQLKYLNEHFEVTAVSSLGKDLVEVAQREGTNVKPINIARRISLLSDLVSLWELYRYFRKEKPDIVHSITPKAGLLSMVAAKYAGVPVRMHTFTGLIFPYRTGVFQKLLIAMDRVLCAHATHIYPEGEGVKKDLISYRITNKPLKIIASGNVNGLDLQYFNTDTVSEEIKEDIRSLLGLLQDDFVFVFVGRMVREKGINELISAFRKISSENSRAKLLLVGNFEHHLDPLKPATLEEIESNPAIHAVGFQKDVRPYFAVSDMLVFPSYREGFPNVILQAMAKELPAIVTDINGCNEIVTHRENGLLIHARSTDQLYSAMKQMLNDRTLYDDMKKKVRNSVLKYDRSIVWNALLAEYRMLLQESGG